jgi:hypothetical protein
MSNWFSNNKDIILPILSLILLVVGVVFTLGGIIGLMGSPSRVNWLGFLAFVVVMLGVPAGVSLVIGIISLALAFICYKKAGV